MHNCQSCMHAIFVAAVLSQQLAWAEQRPTFRTLEPQRDPPPLQLRMEPQMLSRFPTAFSVATAGVGGPIRSIDINGQVWQWPDYQTKERKIIAQTDSEPSCAVISGDGRLLAVAEPNGQVVLMDLNTKEIKFRDKTAAERTVTLRFSPDSGLLAGTTELGEIRLWDLDSFRVARKFSARPGPVQTVAFSPDGSRIAAASFSREVTLLDVSRREGLDKTRPTVISVGDSRVTALAFTPDGGQLVIALADGTTNLRRLAADGETTRLRAHPFAAWSIAFEPDGRRMATGSWDGTIRLWDASTWLELQSVKTHEESVAAMVFHDRQGLLSAGLDGRVLAWSPDIPRIRSSAVINGRSDSVWVAAYSPDGNELFVGGRENRFEIWDVEQQTLLASRAGHPTTRCAAFSPDGKTLATGGDDRKIFFCDAATGQSRTTLLRHPGAVSALVFIDGGKTLISACDGGELKMWDVKTGKNEATWRDHKEQIYCASVSPDEKWLVTGGGNWTNGNPGELFVWDLEAGRLRAKVKGHTLAVWSIVFTADGNRFASSDSSGSVKIWNMKTLEEERTLQHSTWVRALALSPDGKTLAVGRGDGSVRLWDTATWTERASCEGHNSFSFWLQYAPNSTVLASGGSDGTVHFWETQR